MDFYDLFGKRLADAILSGLGLTLAWPLLVAIATAVKLGSPGPVFYRGLRIGKDGKAFRIFKFRTMVVDADSNGPINVAPMDERVTKFGRWLRTSKLDELPQLINVFIGDMSLVGPRPDVPQYAALYSPEDRELILSLQPGLTDWASIINFDQHLDFASAADPDNMFETEIRPLKIELQRHYSRNRGLLKDLLILAWTIRRMVLRDTAVPREIKPYLKVATSRTRSIVVKRDSRERN